MLKRFLQISSLFLPWPAKRWILQKVFGFRLHPTSRIGFALAFPQRLIMEEHTSIGNLTVCRNLDLVHLKPHATIGRGNWITGFPTGTNSPHFAHESDRRAELILEEHAAVTNRHLIDATNRVIVGRFATVAGFQSQILTHSIDLAESRQASSPVILGAFTFVGTNSVILGGSILPNRSVLAAKSLLNKAFAEELHLYGGVPARPLKALPPGTAYFHRPSGHVE